MKTILLAFCIAAFASTVTAQEALKVGDKAPDFEVETLGGGKFKLSDNVGESGKPTILLMSRANW